MEQSILVICWQLLSTGRTFEDLGGDSFIIHDAERSRCRAVAQLESLGCQVALERAA